MWRVNGSHAVAKHDAKRRLASLPPCHPLFCQALILFRVENVLTGYVEGQWKPCSGETRREASSCLLTPLPSTLLPGTNPISPLAREKPISLLLHGLVWETFYPARVSFTKLKGIPKKQTTRIQPRKVLKYIL